MPKHLLALGLALPLSMALAPAQKLAAGMDAPPLKVAKWVKGDAVETFQPGKIYVVEFWATWCGPCIASMPHLTHLQATYKDQGLTVIGVSSADRRNTLAKVEAMVADKGDMIGYAVAWDDGAKTSDAYMKASGQDGIPCSFLVDGKGKIAYIGHPVMFDIPLAGVVSGTWDASKADVLIEAVMKQMGEVVDAQLEGADGAKAALEAFRSKYPNLEAMVDRMLFPRLMGDGKYDRAFAVAARVADRAIAAKDPMTLNEVAWAIVDPEAEIEKRDLDLALKAAQKAVELTKEKDGNILDTLARVWFWKKDYPKALELQKKAVAVEPREDLQKALAEYEKLVAAKDGKDPGQGK